MDGMSNTLFFTVKMAVGNDNNIPGLVCGGKGKTSAR
jgi:hypothetical protein